MKKIFYCWLFALWSIVIVAQPVSAASHLLVGSVVNASGEKSFSRQLVSDGVAELVGEELFKTGNYILLERNPDALLRIKQFAASRGSKVAVHLPDWDVVANVTILKFKKSRQRSFLGPFSKASVKLLVEVQISLQEVAGGEQSARGKGTAKTESVGAFFQVREGKIHFDQTSVGLATARAVKGAVAQLHEGDD